jgi:hypothetical protein
MGGFFMDPKPTTSMDDARLLPRFRAPGTLLERHRAGRAEAAALAGGVGRERRRLVVGPW